MATFNAGHVRLVVTRLTDKSLTYEVEFIDPVLQMSMMVDCMGEQNSADLIETAVNASNLLLMDKLYLAY